ncbi:MAG: hypothetical protein KME04_04995 [Pleurocapsa minor GSE-CHR-MK-17-07R]|jgi:dihydrofolate synthase/folylpolyglutamate synthase|nr:hypothetical protein [Pleurocapsa minor GSE-CHR-MK 17-07R]
MTAPDDAYYAALETLIQPIPASRLPDDLTPMRRLLEALGLHQPGRFPVVKVAGSVGKGSTAHALAALLTRAGKHVGLFTSPHLHSVRERFRIDGEMIAPEAFVNHAGRVAQAATSAGLRPSTFESATALAADWFAASGIDIAVCEIGLGGRFDAVNTLGPTPLAVMTPLELEHVAMLGGSLRSIAWHKAGVFPGGGTAISVAQDAPAAEVFVQEAALAGCILRWASSAADQLAQAAAVLGIASAPDWAEDALASPPPARLEIVHLDADHLLMIDGSHTPRGTARLAEALHTLVSAGEPVRIVFAALKDKPLDDLLRPLDQPDWHIVLSQVPSGHRARPTHEMMPTLHHAALEVQPSLETAFVSIKKKPFSLNVIAGSLTTAAAARDFFGLLTPEMSEEYTRTRALFTGGTYTGKLLQNHNSQRE